MERTVRRVLLPKDSHDVDRPSVTSRATRLSIGPDHIRDGLRAYWELEQLDDVIPPAELKQADRLTRMTVISHRRQLVRRILVAHGIHSVRLKRDIRGEIRWS